MQNKLQDINFFQQQDAQELYLLLIEWVDSIVQRSDS